MSTNTAPTTFDRDACRAHDEQLLHLLHSLTEALHTQSAASDAVMRAAASVRVSHTGEASWSVGTMPYRCKRAELADGTLYYQCKTFTRGDEGYWIKTGPEPFARRAATLSDAVELLDADAAPLARLAEATDAAHAAAAAVRSHEQRYTGWPRFFLVTSSAGHVHRSMHCSTCNPTTTYAPVVSLSGSTDADAVAELGETLCTVCFPDAPVDGRPSKITAAKARKLTAR